MNKRKLSSFALCVMLFAFDFPAEAQQPKKIPMIGYLAASSASTTNANGLRQGLSELGYVEGKTIAVEYRYAEGKLDQLPDLVAELVRLKVDVIVTAGGTSTRAAKNVTATIPIVMTQGDDPIGSGFVASLARPGGNVTGLSAMSTDLSGKRLELLKEIVPKLSRVAVLVGEVQQTNTAQMKEIEVSAQALGLRLQILALRGPTDIEAAFQTARNGRAGAVLAETAATLLSQRTQVADLAVKTRLPVIYTREEFVETGGLMVYAPNLTDLSRRAATYVDKILKGAKPGDLPVEQPTKFEFIVNLKAAKQIGLTIPPNVLARADRVIR
jgi:putative tryptophan/tyrosine transport system substrate-binding protein